jgi:hypothetical protein
MSRTHPFAAVLAYAERHGVRAIGELPGCWEVEADADWRSAVNGQNTARRCRWGVEVPPFSVYVEYQGHPAAIIAATGAGAFAAGDVANAAAFVAALEAKP